MTDIYVETCTIHDDIHLTHHDIHISGSDSSSSSSLSSLGESGLLGRSHQRAGGFPLSIKNDNRFIIWRIIGNKLELIEQSLAHKLNGNFKRISFKDATILPRVHLHKSHEIGMSFNVTILFATTSRLYRIVLPFNKNDHSNTSILSNLCSSDFTNVDASNTFALNLSHVEQPADILVSSRGDALFAFVMPNSAVCCVQMPPSTTQVSSSGRPLMSTQNSGPTLPFKFEINQPTLVKRLWSGLKRGSTAGSLGSSGGLAGSGLSGNENQFASFRLFQLEQSLYLISLCKDFKLKIWCIKSNQCVHTEDMIKYIQFDGDIIWDECQVELLSLPDNCKTSIIISTSDRVKICNLNIELNENIFTINEISRREVIKSGELINVQTTRFNAWLTFKTENESTQVKAVPIGSDDDRNRPNDIIVVDGSQRLANKANQRAKKTRSRRNIANDDSEENIEDDDEEAENDDDEDEDEIDDEERIFIDPGFSDLDVKELYLKLIFEPYRFSKSNMIKSLGILGQNVTANENSSRLISASKSLDEIKELVVRSIEQAVQTHPSYANCGEEEFLSLNVKYWSKYYTMLKQYDYDSRLALGFFADPHNESVVIMIRKNALSFYGKADLSQYYHIVPIEYVQTTFADYFTTDEDTSESESNTTDLFLVFKLLKTINDHVLNSSVAASSDSSRTGKLQYISSLAHELIISNASFLSEFSKYFAEINNTDELTSKLTVLLELFDVEKTRKRLDYLNRTLDSDGDEDDQDNMETDSSTRLSITSDITIDSVLASLKELISKRCEFFRNICVLLTIISSYYETLNISSQVANDLFQKHFESCLNYSNSFEYLKWLCEIYPTSIDKNNLKNSIKRTFDLLDNFQCEQLKSSKDFNQLLLKTFLQSFARFSIPSDSNYQLSLKNYSQLSIYLLANILHAIWPMNLEESFSLIRFFIQNIQYIHLNNYCMQTKWWPTGKNLRLFLLGNCCLFFNNIDQSITYFLRASFNLDKDRCLTKFMGIESASSSHARQSIAANNRRSILINKRTAEKFSQMKRESIFFSSSSHHGDALFSIDSENQLLLDYYTRCIHYYDLNGNVEAAIELIQTALDQSQFDARCKSKLYGVLFKSYMDLEDYERAHTALMSNTDREWKKHSLKHFCTELCKQRRSDLLVGLDYGDMLVELLAFLYKRAQNTDLKTEHGDYYYRVLYAIYVKSKDYRRAAFCMYECSQRLRREINGIESLKRQEKCLLACLNLLKSVDKKLSWLAVLSPDPSTLSASSSSTDIAALETRLRLLNNLMSTDTTAEQQAFNDQLVDSNLNVEIVDFDEINRNYMLVHYMIKLSSIMSNQSSIASFYSADEIIGLLVKYSLFDDAIALCLAFKPLESSPLVNIITGLVDRCCDLNSANTLKALSSNDANNGAIGELTIEYDILKYNESLPAPISPYENPCSFKWKLLHSYLEKFKNVVYYKATCKRLLTLNYEIPSNIIASFKRLNSNALLQIYVNYGLWSEAAELISEYINAILVDEAATKFGTKDSLTPSQLSSQVLLPYAVIDSLLKYLSTGGDDIKEVDLELKKKINEYLYQVKSASESKIKLIGSSRH